MDCKLCREKLNDFVDGGLSADDRRDVERHLATCTSCAHEAAQLRRLSADLKALPRPLPPIGAFNDLLTAFRAEVAAGNGDITPASPWWKRMHRTLGLPRVAALIFCVCFGSFVALTNYFDGKKRPVASAVLAEKSDGFAKRAAADDALAEAQGKPAGETTMSPRIEPRQNGILKPTAKKEESIESADHSNADVGTAAKDQRPSGSAPSSPSSNSGATAKGPTEGNRGVPVPGAPPERIGKAAPTGGDERKKSSDFARLRDEVEKFLGDDATRDSDAEETKSPMPGAGDRAVARADGFASLAWTFLQRERLEVLFDGAEAEKRVFKDGDKFDGAIGAGPQDQKSPAGSRGSPSKDTTADLPFHVYLAVGKDVVADVRKTARDLGGECVETPITRFGRGSAPKAPEGRLLTVTVKEAAPDAFDRLVRSAGKVRLIGGRNLRDERVVESGSTSRSRDVASTESIGKGGDVEAKKVPDTAPSGDADRTALPPTRPTKSSRRFVVVFIVAPEK